MDNNQNQSTAQTPPQASQQPVTPPPAGQTPSQGMSHDTKTLIVILLLIFVYGIGLIFMWLWMKTWPKWVKFVLTIPAVLAVIGIVLAIAVASTDPLGQLDKADQVKTENIAFEFANATTRYINDSGMSPCDFSKYDTETLDRAQDCISELVAKGHLKEVFNSPEHLSSLRINYDTQANIVLLCHINSDACYDTNIKLPSPTPFDQNGTPSPTASPSATQEQIKAALTSKNYAALASYMNENVNFILYASECCGQITATEAASQLSYLDNATPPWDFDQTNSIITKIKAQYASEYGSLFMGIASNEYLAAFGFDQNNKINIIKVAVTYKLLVSE